MQHARHWIAVSAILIALATLLGAFGSHALQNLVPADRLAVWRTAVEYQFFHALGLFAVGLLMQRWPDVRLLAWSASLIALGVLLFCGTLYATVLGAPRWLNLITPLGGLTLMAAWLTLAVGVWRHKAA